MVEFDGRVTRPQLDGQETRPQVDGRQRRHTIDLTAPSEVQEMSTIDDFEDGDLGEYRYDTGSFSIQSDVVKEGSKALRVDSGTNEHISSFPGDGLNYYPESGDTSRFWSRTSNMDRWVLLYFGCQAGTGGPDDTPDGYAAYLDFNRSELRLRKKEGTSSLLTKQTYNYTADTWYDAEIDWGTDGTIVVRLLDGSENVLASISATDTTFSSGGITIQTSGVKGPKYVDYARQVA